MGLQTHYMCTTPRLNPAQPINICRKRVIEFDGESSRTGIVMHSHITPLGNDTFFQPWRACVKVIGWRGLCSLSQLILMEQFGLWGSPPIRLSWVFRGGAETNDLSKEVM